MSPEIVALNDPVVIRMQGLLSRISLPNGLRLQVLRKGGPLAGQTPLEADPAHYFLRLHQPHGHCNKSQASLEWWGRKWLLSKHTTDTEVVATAFKAYLTALEHEAREQFTFDGVPVFDSHTDVHAIVDLRKGGRGEDARKVPLTKPPSCVVHVWIEGKCLHCERQQL